MDKILFYLQKTKIFADQGVYTFLKMVTTHCRRAYFIFLVIHIISISPAVAQDLKLSLALTDCTFETVFKEIEKQTGYKFVYNTTEINQKEIVSVNLKNKELPDVLNTIFRDKDISYRISNKHIALFKQRIKKVTGVIVDSNGETIIGANVVVKGTTNGTVSNIEGHFSLNAPEESTLQITYIGYNSQEIEVKGKNNISVKLQEDTQTIEEVVVVGYGVQKKANVIGSIAQVNSSQLENRSTPQLSNALTGQMAGITVIQRSGRPGDSSGEIRVRGVGSFGATPSALVLIDGLPGEMNDVNMDDVESVSILKDASTSAIYGARAANGVILVTTKNGKKGKVSISYNGYAGASIATALPEFVDSWRYAELYNEAIGRPIYTDEDIQHYKNGTGDPDKYGNARYVEEVLSRNGFQTGHDISVNGGNEKTSYLASFGFLSQNGLVEKNNYSRYNGRLNLINQLLPNLKLTTRLSGIFSDRTEPSIPGGEEQKDMLGIILKSVRMPGLTPSILSDGSFAMGNELHGTPTAWVLSDSFYGKKLFRVNANISLDYEPIKGLKISGIGGYDNSSNDQRTYHSTLKLTDGRTMGPSELIQEAQRAVYKTFQATVDYNKTIKLHDFGLLLGYSWEQEDYSNLKGSRDKFPGNDLPYINAGSPDNQKSEGGGYGWAIQSFFGRLKYNYAERYLFESTIRYDGSSRFPDTQKYGFFPSLAAGWRISEESFMKESESLSWVSGLKLKASWGRLGNQNIENDYYPYQSVYQLGKDYPYGSNFSQGAAVTIAVDPTIKWEETETIDAGIESVLWNGMLTLNASYFYRNTYDILYKPVSSVSLILGKDISQMNTGKLKNKGWEFEIGHHNKIGNVSYKINANFSIIHNEVVSLGVGNVEQLNGMVGNGNDLFIGSPIQLYYGYKTDGVFLDQTDIDNWYDQSKVTPKPKPGDIRYLDISGPEGKPDGKIDPNYDRVPLGSRVPKYTFGVNLNVEYKGFDFSALLQGVTGVNGRLDYFAGYALANQSNIQTWQADGRFDPKNPVRYPEYPRIEDLGNTTPPNYQVSDFWILNASYVRLKNVQLGYTFPKQLMNKIKVGGLRIYAQAENPLSFHGYRKGWDPEINTDGSYYPILATYTFGINLKF